VVSALSDRLPRGPEIVLRTYTVYHSSIVLLNAVVPKLDDTHRSGSRRNYGNAP
jgi:hypothetical protein